MNSNWDPEKLANRYQNQPWYIKLWRDRWLLMVPVWFLRQIGKKGSDGTVLAPAHVWSIERGIADLKRDYWYTWEEVKEHLGKELDDC